MSKKGMQQERNLVNYLNGKGYTSLRVAGSGAGTSRPLPDVLAGNTKDYYAIELKTSSKNFIYIKREQVDGLKEFSRNFGAVPLVCVKFSYMNYFFIPIDKLGVTDGLNYKISREQVLNSKSSYFC